MKRGFLNKNGPTTAKRTDRLTRSTVPPSNPGAPENCRLIEGMKFMDYDPSISQYPEDVSVLTFIGSKNPSTNALGLNERTECIIRGGEPIQTILSIPKFPLPMPKPKQINHQILPTSTMGCGVFATRDLEIGDIILAERPLVVIPRVGCPATQEQAETRYLSLDKYIEPCFEKLTPENRAAYHELSNSHTADGSGPLLGILRTNGFGVQLGSAHEHEHSAVYKELSRLNHSCRPNAVHKFTLPTFSMQVRAMVDIKKGDEIFVSYVSLPKDTPKRQAELVPYGFQCACASCTLPGFDHLYQKTLEHVLQLCDSYDKWVRDRSLPKDHLIKPALKLMPLMDKNGLNCLEIYQVNCETLTKCYAALGDLPNTMKYANLAGLWLLVRAGDSEAYECMKSPQSHIMGPEWRARL